MALGLLLLGGAFALLWAILPRERLLPERATKRVATSSWGLGRGTDDPNNGGFDLTGLTGGTYQWVDERTLLFFRNLPKPFYKVNQNTFIIQYTSASGGIPTLYDLPQQRERALLNLAVLFRKSQGLATNAQVSPDGKWLSWSNDNGNYQIATLQGQCYCQWFNRGLEHWQSDSQGLIETDVHPQGPMLSANIRNLAHIHQAVKVKIVAPTNSNNFVAAGVSAEGYFLTTSWKGDFEVVGQVTLFRVKPGQRSPGETFLVRLPPDTRLSGLVFSPKGDQVAYVLTQARVTKFATFLHRWLPGYEPHPQIVTGLWVSRIDGHNLREIGHVENPSLKTLPPIDYVRWLPDGKRLSFIYQDALWTVPVD